MENLSFEKLPMGTIFYGFPYTDGMPCIMQKSTMTFDTVGKNEEKITTEKIVVIKISGAHVWTWEKGKYPTVLCMMNSFIAKWDRENTQLHGDICKFDHFIHKSFEGLDCYKSDVVFTNALRTIVENLKYQKGYTYLGAIKWIKKVFAHKNKD